MRRAFTPLEISSSSNISYRIFLNRINKRERFLSLTGFTLIEIMVVVSIVVILVTIAVPNFLRSRVVANEVATLANLKIITNGCQLYHINQTNYPESLSGLGESNPPYIDSTLTSGSKQGYEFIYNLVNNDHFTLNANPLSFGLLRGRYFYTDETGIIRTKKDGPAGPEDEIVG